MERLNDCVSSTKICDRQIMGFRFLNIMTTIMVVGGDSSNGDGMHILNHE
jgi:hypothetical protein